MGLANVQVSFVLQSPEFFYKIAKYVILGVLPLFGGMIRHVIIFSTWLG